MAEKIKIVAKTMAALAIAMWGTQLSADVVSDGQMGIVGVRADNDDAFAFAVLIDILAGQSIGFTDNNYLGGGDGSGEGIGGGFWSAESELTWQNNTGGTIAAGTVIVINDNGGGADTADLGTIIGSGDLSFPSNGDALYAYCGNFVSDGFGNLYLDGDVLFGVQFANTGDLGHGGTGQANPGGAAALFEFVDDNGQFVGLRDDQSSYSDYFSSISNFSNWVTDNNGNVFGPLNSADFSTIPEANPLIVICAMGIGLMIRQSKRRSD